METSSRFIRVLRNGRARLFVLSTGGAAALGTVAIGGEQLIAAWRSAPPLAWAGGLVGGIALGMGAQFVGSTFRHRARLAQLERKRHAEQRERRRIEARLHVSEERLRLALAASQTGIFEWNVPGRRLHLSPELCGLLGYLPSQVGRELENWNRLVHEDDLPAYEQLQAKILGSEVSSGVLEYRVRSGNGSWRWLAMRLRTVERNLAGAATRVVGTLQDITPQKEAELALHQSQALARKMALVADRTESLVAIAGSDGRIEWVNESFARTLDYSLEELRAHDPFLLLTGAGPFHPIRRRALLVRRGATLVDEVTAFAKSGRQVHLRLELQPVLNQRGGVETYLAMLTDVTARVETESALRRAKAAADEAARTKSEFLAAMSHELRTPMNGVIGMTSLLLETRLDAEQHDFVGTIRSSAETLLSIVNDILDFSKIESGQIERQSFAFELSKALEDLLDLFVTSAAAKRIELAYHVEANVPAWLSGDLTKLQQILSHLLHNAVKFTPSGSISLLVRTVPPSGQAREAGVGVTLEFTVSDTGIGIPEDRSHRLFQPFSQIEAAHSRRHGGAGLGLAICQRLVAALGGSIRCTSTVGEGSSFVFVLPFAAVESPAGSITGGPERLRSGHILAIDDNVTQQRWLETLLRRWGIGYLGCTRMSEALDALQRSPAPVVLLLDLDLLATAEAEQLTARIRERAIPTLLLVAPGQTTSAPFLLRGRTQSIAKPLRERALRHALESLVTPSGRGQDHSPLAEPHVLAEQIPLEVLLVEDNVVNQKVALRFLHRLGYRADAVGNGAEAITALNARPFDLLLMDLQMPGMDGLEATRRIRQQLPFARQPKIVALTANAVRGDREMCLAGGMDDYLAKPVTLHGLSEVIRRQFGRPPVSRA